MINNLVFTFLILALSSKAQTDFSDKWEDLYSYNNVKRLTKFENTIYALVDNAVFTYNTTTKQLSKMSSVQGLSGKTTSAIHYSEASKKLIIGYQDGSIEIVDKNREITIALDIKNFSQSGDKKINDISEYNGKLYLSTPFAIVVYDIEKSEFGDTYFIGANSSAVEINQTAIIDGKLCAATKNGIYLADINDTNIINSNNWELKFDGEYKKMSVFDNKLYGIFKDELRKLNYQTKNSFETENKFAQQITDLETTNSGLIVCLPKKAIVFDTSLKKTAEFVNNSVFKFELNTATTIDDKIYLGTKTFGILSAPVGNPENFTEIHPDGPLANDPFSITAKNNNLWVVYGGYSNFYAPLPAPRSERGYSHLKNGEWINTRFSSGYGVPNLVDVSIDPKDDSHVFITSTGVTYDTNVNSVRTGGLLEIKDDKEVKFYNHNNSGLENLHPPNIRIFSVRIGGSAFDKKGNLWVANSWVDKKLKKMNPSGKWSGYDLSSLYKVDRPGVNDAVVDGSNSIWVGTRGNGAYVFNQDGNRKTALTTAPTRGNLPSLNVRTIAVDKNDQIWIGTLSGMVVFNNPAGVFDAKINRAEPIIISDQGINKKLMGDQTINSIAIDGANNKWIGSATGGVLYTSPDGLKTLANFNTENSPLPSNTIVKIDVDKSTGKVYFATDRGIVAYNGGAATFGQALEQVYAYPNPSLSTNSFITIDARGDEHLPKGTNVKILDVSGNLVYETNVAGQGELQGGKVIWNKTNLAGEKVASGVYIVLLSNKDNSQTAVTKIAIVN